MSLRANDKKICDFRRITDLAISVLLVSIGHDEKLRLTNVVLELSTIPIVF